MKRTVLAGLSMFVVVVTRSDENRALQIWRPGASSSTGKCIVVTMLHC